MTLQNVKNELKKINQKILDIEKELIIEDADREISSIEKKRNKEFLKKWEELAKEVSSKWDDISLSDELKYQREKD